MPHKPDHYLDAPWYIRLLVAVAMSAALTVVILKVHNHEGPFNWPDVVILGVTLLTFGAFMWPNRARPLAGWVVKGIRARLGR